ncbi:MAG TPA: hypothetical protein VKV17_05180 [Bryobacteraceae bacterium]|nr:hypothetical protein [Bryobacteraceae bacterium]
MPRTVPNSPPPIKPWPGSIPPAQWEIYRCVIDAAMARKIPFALGGAFALAAHTGIWRDTKDLDLYVLPRYRDSMIEVVRGAGLADYYDKLPYDRWWIYRGTADGTIVDVIWAMANHRAQIDELWMSGPSVEIHGRILPVLPPEALIWDKLYILQRDRCDWPDVLNLIFYAGSQVDWELLTERMGDHLPLLAAALVVFRWIAPGCAETLPPWLWAKLQLQPPSAGLPASLRERASLLDTRPWFGPERPGLARASQEPGEC